MHYEKFADGTVKCIEDEIPFELPEGWSWYRLGSVFATITGSTPTTKDASLYGNDFPFYKPTDLDNGFWVNSATDNVSEKGFMTGRQLPEKSVLVTCIGATIGKTGLIHRTGICNQQINAIIPNINIIPEYVYYLLCSKFEQDQIKRNASATTLPILNKSRFDSLLIVLPPKEQQHQIARKITELWIKIDSISENKNRLLCDVAKVKSKILDLAIRGKLVPQDPDDEPATMLLERIRAEKEELIKAGKIKRNKKESFIFKGEDNSYYDALPDNWAECSILSIAEVELGKTLDKAKNTGTYYPYLRSVNIKWDDVDLTDVKEMKFEESERTRYSVKKNDLLICEGGDVGRCCIWNSEQDIYYQNALHRVRFYGNCHSKYFLYIMMYLESIGYLKRISNGVTIKHLTKNVLASIPFLLPPLTEQQRIVEAIENIFSTLDAIVDNIS